MNGYPFGMVLAIRCFRFFRILLVAGIVIGLGDAIIHATTHDCTDHPCQSCHLARSAALPAVAFAMPLPCHDSVLLHIEPTVSSRSHSQSPAHDRAPPSAPLS